MNKAVVALGSNIEAQAYMAAAIDLLKNEFTVLGQSSFVVTKPLGILDQPDFLNGVVLIAVGMEAPALASRLKELEVLLGRQPRDNKWGPREIDLDLLVWNGKVVNKDFYERDFLRKAVAEIAPDIARRCC